MKMKNNLDEMQEQELLKIEHNGCWLAFWLLLVSLITQCFIFDSIDFKTLAGEWIVFMVLALYLGFACVRKGIWDRKLAMNTKTNLIASALAGIVMGVLNAVMVFKNYHKPFGTFLAAGIVAIITFILCFVILTIMMKQTKKHKDAMEAEPADANDL